jgi:DNA-binding GntR family transcriptional regulator
MFSQAFRPTGDAPLADELFLFLRHALLEGDLEPGARLVETAIAEATDVSRTPVREALRQLKAAGLIEQKGRSFVVATLSSKEFRDLWVVMECLQARAARLAAVHRSEIDLVEFSHLVELGRAATRDDDIAAIIDINRRFHIAIHEAAQNRFLSESIDSSILRLERIQDFTTARRRLDAQHEHEVILRALESQDPARAEEAMLKHLENQLMQTVTNYEQTTDSALNAS